MKMDELHRTESWYGEGAGDGHSQILNYVLRKFDMKIREGEREEERLSPKKQD